MHDSTSSLRHICRIIIAHYGTLIGSIGWSWPSSPSWAGPWGCGLLAPHLRHEALFFSFLCAFPISILVLTKRKYILCLCPHNQPGTYHQITVHPIQTSMMISDLSLVFNYAGWVFWNLFACATRLDSGLKLIYSEIYLPFDWFKSNGLLSIPAVASR